MRKSAKLEQAADLCVCANLRRAARIVTRRFDEAYLGTGIRSTQSPILLSLMTHGKMTMSELADDVGLDNSTLSRNFRILEDNGLVKRKARDGRTMEVEATDKAVRIMKKIDKRWKTIQAATVSEIGGEENWAHVLRMLSGLDTVAET